MLKEFSRWERDQQLKTTFVHTLLYQNLMGLSNQKKKKKIYRYIHTQKKNPNTTPKIDIKSQESKSRR